MVGRFRRSRGPIGEASCRHNDHGHGDAIAATFMTVGEALEVLRKLGQGTRDSTPQWPFPTPAAVISASGRCGDVSLA